MFNRVLPALLLLILLPAFAQTKTANTRAKFTGLTPGQIVYVKDASGKLKRIKVPTSGTISVSGSSLDVTQALEVTQATQVGKDEKGKTLYAPGDSLLKTETGVTTTKTTLFGTDGKAQETSTSAGALTLKGLNPGETVTLEDSKGNKRAYVVNSQGQVRASEGASFTLDGVKVFSTKTAEGVTVNQGNKSGETGYTTTFDLGKP